MSYISEFPTCRDKFVLKAQECPVTRKKIRIKRYTKNNEKNVCKQKKSKKLCSVSTFKTGQTFPDPAFQCFDPAIDLSPQRK